MSPHVSGGSSYAHDLTTWDSGFLTCGCGKQCGRSAAAVGVAATSAVVTGIVWIIASDGLCAVLTERLGLSRSRSSHTMPSPEPRSAINALTMVYRSFVIQRDLTFSIQPGKSSLVWIEQ